MNTKSDYPRGATVALLFANFFGYGLNALYYSFIPMYIDLYHTSVIKGVLLAVGPIISIFAPIIWGAITDKAKYKNSIIILLTVLSAASFFAAYFYHSFLYLFITISLIMFFLSPVCGLIDTITLEYTSSRGMNYGALRLMGTVGFGAVGLITGFFTEGGIGSVFYIFLCVAFLTVVSTALSPKIEGHSRRKEKFSFAPVFSDKKLMLMLFFTAFAYLNFGFYQSFYSKHLTEVLNFPDWVWGVNVFMTITGEIPFFIGFDKIMKRLGKRKILIICSAMGVIRCLWLAAASSVFSVLAAGALTGWFLVPINYCASTYMNENLPDEIKASGQSIMYGLFVGVPRVICTLAGGIIVSYLGVDGGLLVFGALCAIPLMLVPLLKKLKLE